MSSEILILENLRKSFGKTIAVDDLNLGIRENEIFGLLGPNGAGKTTTLKMICSQLKPDSGKIIHNKSAITDTKCVSVSIGVCPQEIVIWDLLTCREQLIFSAKINGLPNNMSRINTEKVLIDLGLKDHQHKLSKNLSGGMKRRLNIALAVVHNPSLIVLDEPEAGLDPQSRILVREYIRSLTVENKTVIYISHNMDEVDRVCNRIAIVDKGKLLICDTPESLKQKAGTGDLLEFSLSDDLPIDILQKTLNEKLGSRFIELRKFEQRYIIRMIDAPNHLSILLDLLKDKQVHPENISFRTNTLEDVFINLTGRSLRQ